MSLCLQIFPLNLAIHPDQVGLVLLSSPCCPLHQVVLELLVFRPCLVDLLAHRVLEFLVVPGVQDLLSLLAVQVHQEALGFLEGR